MRGRASSSLPIFSTPFEEQKLSTDGSVFHIAISPDGKNVVYTHRVNGKQSIWLRELASANNMQIVAPSDSQFYGATFSRAGDYLYYIDKERNNTIGTLYRVP